MKTSSNKTIVNTIAHANTLSTANFWILWSANSFSNLGDGLYQITLPLLAAQLTRSPALVAGVGVMLSLPWLVFALQAGSIVDRFDRRQIMLGVNGGRFFILICLTITVVTKVTSLPILYIAALLLGIGETLMDTSLVSIIPSLVTKDRLNWANARITAAQTATNTFIGPPLAGFLASLGIAVATGSSTFMYAAAGFALMSIHGTYNLPSEEKAQFKQDWWEHLTQGLRFLWNNCLLRNLTLFTASMNLFWASWGALLVLYAVAPGPMGLNEFEYGLLLTAMAVGGLLGSILCERIQKKIGTRNALALDLLGTAMLVGIPALTTNALGVGMACFAAGFGASVWVILVATIRQKVTPNTLMGRVYSASRFISWGVGPLGAALAAAVAEVWTIQIMFAASGIVSVCLLLIFLTVLPSQRLDILEKTTKD